VIRLGHIAYSNCHPIHSDLLDPVSRPQWLRVTSGPPDELNALLARGELDLAPASSIEWARHWESRRALAGLCIGSDGPVQSIILAARLPLAALDGRRVALPTASATSSVLLRILLETRAGVRPRWEDFRQHERDPMDDPAVAAALFIGDVALRRSPREGELRFDLGREWTEWTGLPFGYAVWQAREEVLKAPELPALHEALLRARDAVPRRAAAMAAAAATMYGIPATRLVRYWHAMRYRLDAPMRAGIERFFRLAAEVGEVDSNVRLRTWPD